MKVSGGFYVERSKYGIGPYLLVRLILEHSEVPTADAINRFAEEIVDRIVAEFPPAYLIKTTLELIYGKLTPTIAGHDKGAGTIVEVRAPAGGVGVPYSKVYPRDNSSLAPPQAEGVILYKDSQFRGEWLFLPYEDCPHLSAYGYNDKVSSIRANRGKRFLAFEHADYKGRCLLVEGDIPQVSRFGFHDSISSVKRLPNPKGVTLFKDARFEGASSFFGSSVSHTSSVGLNDAISSVKLHYGARCKVFEHADFKGKSIDIYSDCANLGSLGFNDKVSSMLVY
ncbi:MAG: beta/gamma crystallin-related protein [Spirochaetota bacterium]